MAVEIHNLEDVVPAEILDLFPASVLHELLADLADAARSEWIRLAQSRLNTSRGDYIRGIQPVVMGIGQATVSLVGVVPHIVEDDTDTMDLREILLGPQVPIGSPGKKEAADGGFYRSIPFKHGTPSSRGAAGLQMGRAYSKVMAEEDAARLGRKVYKAAKKLGAHTTDPYSGTRVAGEQLKAGLAPKLRPDHATDIYAGMIREQKTYEKATQSQYMTFRTIAVDPAGQPRGSASWIRGATQGQHLATEVNRFVGTIAPKTLDAYMKERLG